MIKINKLLMNLRSKLRKKEIKIMSKKSTRYTTPDVDRPIGAQASSYIMIDETDYIDEVDWNKLKKLMPKGKGKIFVGCDFAKGEGTAAFGYLDKDGNMVIDKVTKI